MIGVVYQLEFPNGKVYIGITTRFKRRMGEHRNGANYEDGHAVRRAIKKYGWANVKVTILEGGIADRELLKEREVHWIQEKASTVREWGYNLTAGGDAQPMEHPVVKAWHKERITEAMNRKDVRAKKRALWQDDGHKEMMQEARLNFESAEKRRLGFARKREEKIRTMSMHEGKALMRNVRAKLTNNATNPGRVATPGQLEDAKAFWQREWERYERKYWSAPPQASWISHPLPQQTAGVSEGAGPSVQAGVAHSAASPRSPRTRTPAGGLRNAEESDEDFSDWWVGARNAGLL